MTDNNCFLSEYFLAIKSKSNIVLISIAISIYFIY